MGKKIANAEVVEDLKVEMNDDERKLLKDTLGEVIHASEKITIDNARMVLAHAMLESYKKVSYDHEPVKSYFRQIVKKYLNGSKTSEDESKACKELIDMMYEE